MHASPKERRFPGAFITGALLCDKPAALPRQAGCLASHTISGRTKESSPSRTPSGHSLWCCSHTGRPRPELEPRGYPQRVWPSFPNHRDRPTHSGPGEGGSRRPQPRCPIWPHDGAVGPAAEPPRIQPPRALTPDPPDGKSGFGSQLRATARLQH